MTSISVDLELIDLNFGLVDHALIACPSCDELLVIHQPDVQSPDHLLGTCDGCPAWFLLDLAAGVMLRLPAVEALREPSLRRGAVA
jgi:hypothetical protein